MSKVVADSFPFLRSSCIIREFGATHIDRVICSNFGFPFPARRTVFPLLELFPISCSSSLMAYVPRLTKSGINKGFSPCLVPAFCWRPRNTCWSLSSRDRVVEFSVAGDLPDPLKSVVKRAKIEFSSVPISSIFFRISSRPPSFATVLVVTGVVSSLVVSLAPARFNFLKVASKIRYWPTLRPRFSESLEARSFKASSLSRSSFSQYLNGSFFQLVSLAPRFKVKSWHFSKKISQWHCCTC